MICDAIFCFCSSVFVSHVHIYLIYILNTKCIYAGGYIVGTNIHWEYRNILRMDACVDILTNVYKHIYIYVYICIYIYTYIHKVTTPFEDKI